MKKIAMLYFLSIIFLISPAFSQEEDEPMERIATFAGGCFWCLESSFDQLNGVLETTVGYTGGSSVDPDYKSVSSGNTGYAEAIQIRYDPQRVSYIELLKTFWGKINPTQADGQFADRGSQYRTAIFYHDDNQHRQAEESKRILEESGIFNMPIATQVLPAEKFYSAEEYHQDYYKKNPQRYRAYYQGSGRSVFCPLNIKAISKIDILDAIE